MTSLRRHFLENSSADFSDFFVADVKLMLGRVLKVSRLYLPPFLSYPENPAGRGDRICPSVGRVKAGVNYTYSYRYQMRGTLSS